MVIHWELGLIDLHVVLIIITALCVWGGGRCLALQTLTRCLTVCALNAYCILLPLLATVYLSTNSILVYRFHL